MKIKLTVEQLEKFKLACEANDVKVIDTRNYGKKTVVQVDYKHGQQLYEIGLLQDTVVLQSDEKKAISEPIKSEQVIKSKK
jgi:hypothetical protein